LPREGQKFHDATIGTAHLSGRQDDLREFLVVWNPVSGDFLCRQGDAFGRGLIEHGLAHAPAQKRLERLQGLVGRSAPLLDRRNDLNHISFADLMNAPAGPGLSHLSTQKPRNLATGSSWSTCA
jgi:hypothetical protein